MTRTCRDLLRERLHNQKLGVDKLRTAADVVSWLGAVQSQDYAGARWAVGQRMSRATHADVERAFNAGEILRTHVLRPTWHFVTPADIRWMLALTAPRVQRVCAPYFRRKALEAKTLVRACRRFERVLEGQQFLTRAELATALAHDNIKVSGEQLPFITLYAELEMVICSGPRRGKQFTYALVDERAPRAKTFQRDDALAELTRRFFQSHGPATERDFAWWSGLTIREARRGIEMLGKTAARELVDDHNYCRLGRAPRRPSEMPNVLLLPNYDEALVAYQDRDLFVPAAFAKRYGTRGSDDYIHHLLVDGRLAGSWRPTATRGPMSIEYSTYGKLTAGVARAIRDEANRYRLFLRSA